MVEGVWSRCGLLSVLDVSMDTIFLIALVITSYFTSTVDGPPPVATIYVMAVTVARDFFEVLSAVDGHLRTNRLASVQAGFASVPSSATSRLTTMVPVKVGSTQLLVRGYSAASLELSGNLDEPNLKPKPALGQLVLLFAGSMFSYFMSSFLQWMRIAIASFVIYNLWHWEHRGTTVQRGSLVVLIFFRWFRLLMSLCLFEVFGPRVLPIISSVRDTVPFFVVSILAIVTFTHAYYATGMRPDDGSGSTFYEYFLLIFRLSVLGEGDMVSEPSISDKNGRGQDDRLVSVIFFLTSLTMTVLLMSILVGILGSNYERDLKQSRSMFNRVRARKITNLSSVPWFRQHIWQSTDLFLWIVVTERDGKGQGQSSEEGHASNAVWSSAPHSSVGIEEIKSLIGCVEGIKEQQSRHESLLVAMQDQMDELFRHLKRFERAHVAAEPERQSTLPVTSIREQSQFHLSMEEN